MAKKKSKADLVQEIFAEASKEELPSLWAIASYWARKGGLLARKKAGKVIPVVGRPADSQIAKMQ